MPVINVKMFEGRDSAKSAIAKDITDSIAKHASVDPKYIYVIFDDVKTENWAIEGELFSETLKK
uniref:tautomerase family protein n=1 Tax=Marinobacterium profundum TaxID=1714300 RepID=UPI00082DF612|nr:4-oxalocrotonate tautomerase family protein [Marinobacterium profundum]